ncbi:hypothetical protein E2C01_088792 [Portunus trituberculatus]|uniref:Uncharacterized protein n=1 Tax=Portunus trituberculatus TaxID=210409 RepID=A0A5B7JGF0_PORTR|nr:hypothetical protein [Portunus trituberculatus]
MPGGKVTQHDHESLPTTCSKQLDTRLTRRDGRWRVVFSIWSSFIDDLVVGVYNKYVDSTSFR